MERTPKHHKLTIDTNREGVCLDLGIGQIHLRFRRHGKKYLTVDWEQIGGALVVTKSKHLDAAIPPKVD